MKVKLCTVFFLLFAAFWLFANEEVGVITMLEGDVIIRRDDAEMAVDPGDVVFEEDVIVTGEESAAEVELYEGLGNVRIKEGSELSMAYFIGGDDSTGLSLSLTLGSINNQVTGSESGSELYTVTTPTITLGVRGTDFEVVVTEIGDTLIEVSEGEVAVGELGGDDSEVYSDDYNERSGELILKKGEMVERLINGKEINRRKIDRESWREERLEHFRENPEETLLLLEKKLFMLHKRLEKLNRALFFIISVEKSQGRKISEVKSSLKDLGTIPDDKRAELERQLEKRAKLSSEELKREMFKVLKVSRLMLDEYHSTKRMIKNILEHIKRHKIEIRNKKAFALFLKRLERIKELDRDMMKFEHIWRTIVDRHRPAPKDKRRSSYKDGAKKDNLLNNKRDKSRNSSNRNNRRRR